MNLLKKKKPTQGSFPHSALSFSFVLAILYRHSFEVLAYELAWTFFFSRQTKVKEDYVEEQKKKKITSSYCFLNFLVANNARQFQTIRKIISLSHINCLLIFIRIWMFIMMPFLAVILNCASPSVFPKKRRKKNYDSISLVYGFCFVSIVHQQWQQIHSLKPQDWLEYIL